MRFTVLIIYMYIHGLLIIESMYFVTQNNETIIVGHMPPEWCPCPRNRVYNEIIRAYH